MKLAVPRRSMGASKSKSTRTGYADRRADGPAGPASDGPGAGRPGPAVAQAAIALPPAGRDRPPRRLLALGERVRAAARAAVLAPRVRGQERRAALRAAAFDLQRLQPPQGDDVAAPLVHRAARRGVVDGEDGAAARLLRRLVLRGTCVLGRSFGPERGARGCPWCRHPSESRCPGRRWPHPGHRVQRCAGRRPPDASSRSRWYCCGLFPCCGLARTTRPFQSCMLSRLLFLRKGPDLVGSLIDPPCKDTPRMKIRLIEPISPSRHLWSKSYFVRLGLPMIGAALVEAGHDVRIFNPQLAPIDWADVYSSDLVGLSSTTSTILEAYRIGDDLRRRGIPVVIGGSHVTFMADEALQHADYVARGEAGETIMVELAEALAGEPRAQLHHRHLVPRRGRPGRARAAARALRGPRHAAVPGPHARGRLGADHQHAHHDQLGLPVRLHLLLGDGDVRQEVPLPQRRERGGGDQAEEARRGSSSTTTTWPPTASVSSGCCSS